jgi:protein-disulfide isomerase
MRVSHRFFLAFASLSLIGASCQKKAAPKAEDPGPNLAYESSPTAPAPAPAPAPPVTGHEGHDHTPTAGSPPQPLPMGAGDPKRVDALVAKLQSPCGKAHSLAKSIETDKACKRAPFAKKYVELLVALGATDDEVTQLYGERYTQNKSYEFDLRETAFLGKPNAPVQIAMFFDYNCPHCRDKEPILEELVKRYPDGVVVFFKNFPLTHNKESPGASAAAIAAQRQGKFMAMHKKLFENQGVHDKTSLAKYAREIGLDEKRFAADSASAQIVARVEADRQEGLKAEIKGTPTLYLNGRTFSDPIVLELLTSWVEEELAVNR